MKILGIDFGTKRIGLAIAQEGLVTPLVVITCGSRHSPIRLIRLISQIGQICQEEGVEKIVVGVSEGRSAKEAKAFGQKLAKKGWPVEFADETLTTAAALVKMKTVGKKWKDKADAIAAALILENYLSTKSKIPNPKS
jgi:putative Holliday junction resolvase